MPEKNLNGLTMTLRLKRREVIYLMLAVNAVSEDLEADFEAHEHWDRLHDKLKAMVSDFDEAHK